MNNAERKLDEIDSEKLIMEKIIQQNTLNGELMKLKLADFGLFIEFGLDLNQIIIFCLFVSNFLKKFT